MNNMIIIIYTLLCLIFFTQTLDYYIYEVTAFNPYERNKLYNMHQYSETITFINGISNEAAIPNNVIVPRDQISFFVNKLLNFGLQYTHKIKWNMEVTKRNEETYDKSPINMKKKFHSWSSILYWMTQNLVKQKYIEKIVIAKTYENRDVIMIKISKSATNPAVVIVGGELGMDWMSSAILLNFLSNILYNRKLLSELITNFTIYLIPLLNPDGFVYSKQKYRFWTKNRKTLMYNNTCVNKFASIGVSLERNWFLEPSNKKLEETCSALYMGPKPLSEEETLGLSYVLNNLALNMIAFINVRGFGNYISIPYGYTKLQTNNHDIVMEILQNTCNEIKHLFNTSISVGTSNSIFYNSSGNVADWVKYKLNTPIVFTINLNHEESIQHLPKYISPLSERFYAILKNSLLTSKEIYGPLFSHQLRITNTYFFILSILLINSICIFFILI